MHSVIITIHTQHPTLYCTQWLEASSSTTTLH